MSRPQTPAAGEIFLDHVAWFVPAMAHAEAALLAMGFALTPFTRQMNQTPDGPVPAGMANRCAMLESGYLEFLTAVADTPLAAQFHAQTARYVGLHLLAFTEADPFVAHARLEARGFHPDPPVALRRRVELPDGDTAEAAFTVLRLPASLMPEGRIQLLAHHTPEAIWQERWTAQPNGIGGLEAVLLAVADPAEAADRFARFLDRPATPLGDGRERIRLDRGALVFAAPDWVEAHLGALPSPAPVIAAVALATADATATGAALVAGGAVAGKGAGYDLPPAVGSSVTLTAPGVAPRWAT